MKYARPTCFGSNPMAQERAENDCDSCVRECQDACMILSRFHRACQRLTWINADDYAASSNLAGLQHATKEYYTSRQLCESLGIDTAKETAGRGYLL